MDSSHSDQAGTDSFSPWQIQRIRARLSHYRAAKRHGWERIATDILLDESLPEAYVDSEDVRPLSESLRRLEGGSQTPSLERLHAIRTFLVSQGLLRPGDLVEKDTLKAAPLAFAEFAAKNLPNFDAVHNQCAKELSGSFFWIERTDAVLQLHELTLSPNGTILGVQLSRTSYNDPTGQMAVTNNRNRRNHAVINEYNYSGWAAILSGNQIVLMLREILFDAPSACHLLYATEAAEDAGGAATKLLLLPYTGTQKYENFDSIPFPSEERPVISILELYERTTPRGFQIYTREDSDGQ